MGRFIWHRLVLCLEFLRWYNTELRGIEERHNAACLFKGESCEKMKMEES